MIPPASDLLGGLNPQQLEAVQHFEGPILVLAGAGSGKTRVLTARVGHLVREHGVPTHRILAVTFTNKAAGEMRDRIRRMLGGDPAGMWAGTFHSLGARLLRRHAPSLGWSSAFTIYDADQSLRQIKRTQELLDIDPKRWNPKAIRGQLSSAKNALVTPEEFADSHGEGFDLFLRQVARVYPAYQQALKDQNAFDFDDLLVKPVELFQGHPDVLARYRERFAFVLVDEYQDTNQAQFRFLELLAREHTNLMVVGDDDQSIYGWRGADITNILGFEETFPGAAVVRLEQNYRSTDLILQAANAVIARNIQRKGKTLRTDRSGGDSITRVEAADETDEARWIVGEIEARMLADPEHPYRDFTILYRTNAQSRALEDAFRRRGLPYQIVGGVRFYERREIQDVLAYLRLISNPLDGGAFARIVNLPRRGIGATSQDRLARWARVQEISLLEAALRAEEAPDVPAAATRSLVRFAQLIQRFSLLAAQVPVGALIEELVEELDLLMHLREEGPDGDDRADNVRELIAGAVDFDAEMDDEWEGERPDNFTELDLFLQKVSLVADIDRHDPDADAVLLMTLHNAKGLEFPVVFIAGLEEGLFPLSRSRDDPDQLEEERRLFYVGITRAEDKLYFTHARQRRRAGEFMYGMLSSFAEDVPDGLVEVRVTPRLKAARTTFDPRPRRDSGDLFAQAAHRARRGGSPEDAGGSGGSLDDVDLDMSMNQDLPRFVEGEKVRHATFGSGAVVEVSGFGRDLRVTVDFQSVGRKRLLARYAHLEKDYF